MNIVSLLTNYRHSFDSNLKSIGVYNQIILVYHCCQDQREMGLSSPRFDIEYTGDIMANGTN